MALNCHSIAQKRAYFQFLIPTKMSKANKCRKATLNKRYIISRGLFSLVQTKEELTVCSNLWLEMLPALNNKNEKMNVGLFQNH